MQADALGPGPAVGAVVVPVHSCLSRGNDEDFPTRAVVRAETETQAGYDPQGHPHRGFGRTDRAATMGDLRLFFPSLGS